jgi:hypothetical protein
MRVLAFVACLATGCSFAFTSSPPANHRQLPYFECSSSRVAPILDVLWTTLQVLNLTTLASKTDAEFNAQFETNPGQNDPPFQRKTGMAVNAAFGALGAAGAYYGFTKVRECRAAKNELMLRMGSGGQQPGPGTWPPPTPAPAPAPAPAPPPAPEPAPEPAAPPPD